MPFKIDDLTFNISSAILEAYVDEDSEVLIWDLEIKTEEQEVLGERWMPQISTDGLRRTEAGELADWRDFGTYKTEWEEGYDEEEDEAKGNFYVFEHQHPNNSKVEITYNPKDGFFLKWTGDADIFFSKEKYWDAVPFEITTPLIFSAVLCGRLPEDEARKKVEPYLPKASFKFVADPSRLAPA